MEAVADSVVDPAKAPSLSEFVSAASPLSSIAGLADQSNAAAIAPEAPAPRETFLLSDWEYPRQPQADSRPRIRGVAIAAIVIVVVALTVIFYGYHDSVGQLLISLGQKLSAPKEAPAAPASSASQAASVSQTTSAPQPLKVPDVSKPSVESPQPVSAATRENIPASPEKGLADERRYRTENTSASVKPQTTLGAASPAPATSASVAQSEDPAERVHSLWAAVAQGNTSAEVTLAKLYLIGGGVTKSCDQARVLLQAAAKKGNGEALDKLSQINQQGCP